MKRIFSYMLLVAVAFAMQSCVKDLQDDIQDGGWNHERSIISIAFENQIGNASIDNVDAETGEIELSININAQPSMSSVKLLSLETSYQSKCSVKVGDVLDFSSGTATIEITSSVGEPGK